MILVLKGHGFQYELENICRLFYPFEKIKVGDLTADDGEMRIVALRSAEGQRAVLRVDVYCGDSKKSAEYHIDTLSDGFEDECERLLAVGLYNVLSEITGIRPKWGILTGVRPGKLMRRMIASGSVDSARAWFADKLLVSEDKIGLCIEASENEEKIIAGSRPDDFSLYVSIPFCPSRCSYCSFVSHSVEKSFKLVDDYVRLLCEELEQTGKIAERLGLHLSTIYIGGGTPTVLTPGQLKSVMGAVRDNFDAAGAAEYTVEAGRPDTITDEKLRVIGEMGATRISINPQTLNDDVLRVIGRNHTAQQTVDAFRAARDCGFDNINMDLIAGLPSDTYDSFASTLERVLDLSPESVTVHTLSMKRSSRLTVSDSLPERESGVLADRMLCLSRERLGAAGYAPYYLYRQSKTVGNLENTGYSKPGRECLYNIYIMDETHTILACGASAVTKLKAQNGYIERIFNFKYPYEYISRFSEMLNRKEKVESFYAKQDGANFADK